MTKELEEYAIDVIKNHSRKLVKNFTETDLINRELTIFNEGYKKGYKDGFKQAKFDCEMDKLDGT